MRIAASLVCLLIGFCPAFAQQPPVPIPVGPVPAVPAAPYRLHVGAAATASQGSTTRLEHLLEAAVHLEAAGEFEQAQQVRRLVGQEREALQGRLGSGKTGADARQVLIEFRVFEVVRGCLVELGFDQAAAQKERIPRPFDRTPFQFNLLEDNRGLLSALEDLRKAGKARILAEPTIVGVSGRPTSFHAGGEIPVVCGSGLGHPGDDSRSALIGTQVDLVPLVIEPDNIRLDMKVSVAEPIATLPDKSGNSQLPKVRTVTIDTGVEMESGQTCVVRGLITRKGDSDAEPAGIREMETIFLTTARILETPLAAQAGTKALE